MTMSSALPSAIYERFAKAEAKEIAKEMDGVSADAIRSGAPEGKSFAFYRGWNAWLAGKSHNYTPYSHGVPNDDWSAGLEAAAHRT